MDTPQNLRQQLYSIIFFTDTPAGQRFGIKLPAAGHFGQPGRGDA